MVRSQQLGIQFGQLGPIDGSGKGDGGGGAFGRGFGRLFKRIEAGETSGQWGGQHEEQNTVTEDLFGGQGFGREVRERYTYKTEHRHC